MTDPTSIPTKIRPADLIRLQAFATSRGLNCVQAIARLLDIAEAFPNIDTLPRPEGGAIIPVVEVSHE
jgi:hypothetical protein